MDTDRFIVGWIDEHNLCSYKVGGCWLTAEDYQSLQAFFKDVDSPTIKWLDKHNAMEQGYGLNIGSNIWQPYRKNILGEK